MLTPLLLSHFVTRSGTPKKYAAHLGPPFLAGLVQKTSTKTSCKNSLSIVHGLLSRVLARGSFVWKVLSGVIFVRSPSVRIHLLQQKAKHHFKSQVPYYV